MEGNAIAKISDGFHRLKLIALTEFRVLVGLQQGLQKLGLALTDLSGLG
jgi:hypothetical protein